jgi:hypothetical protein
MTDVFHVSSLSVQEPGLVIPDLDCDPFQILSNLSFIVCTAIWNFMVRDPDSITFKHPPHPKKKCCEALS